MTRNEAVNLRCKAAAECPTLSHDELTRGDTQLQVARPDQSAAQTASGCFGRKHRKLMHSCHMIAAFGNETTFGSGGFVVDRRSRTSVGYPAHLRAFLVFNCRRLRSLTSTCFLIPNLARTQGTLITLQELVNVYSLVERNVLRHLPILRQAIS